MTPLQRFIDSLPGKSADEMVLMEDLILNYVLHLRTPGGKDWTLTHIIHILEGV